MEELQLGFMPQEIYDKKLPPFTLIGVEEEPEEIEITGEC